VHRVGPTTREQQLVLLVLLVLLLLLLLLLLVVVRVVLPLLVGLLPLPRTACRSRRRRSSSCSATVPCHRQLHATWRSFAAWSLTRTRAPAAALTRGGAALWARRAGGAANGKV
jgi:hypothetical protein